MANSLATRVFIVLVIVGLVLAGCVQTKTTPGYARAGDHVVIGLGGLERNAGGEPIIRDSDLTITLTDSSTAQFVLEPRLIFKSYPDYASKLNSYSYDGTNILAGLTGMVPYDGGWYVLAPLTLPGQYDQPLALTPGPATISVTSSKLTNTGDSSEGDLTAIPIEIISGTSAQDFDFVRQFIAYSPTETQFVVAPDNLTGITEVGGAFFVIEYADDSQFFNGIEPQVVPGEHHPFVQLSYNVVPNGNGTGTIYVTLLNPEGFRTLGTATPNSSLLTHLSVRLVYYSTGSVAQAKANFSLNATESYYIRPDGTELAGLAPQLTHLDDL